MPFTLESPTMLLEPMSCGFHKVWLFASVILAWRAQDEQSSQVYIVQKVIKAHTNVRLNKFIVSSGIINRNPPRKAMRVSMGRLSCFWGLVFMSGLKLSLAVFPTSVVWSWWNCFNQHRPTDEVIPFPRVSEGTEKRSETLFLVFPLPTSHQLSVQSFLMDLQDESERMEDLANLVVMGITVVIIAGVVIGVVAGIAEPTGNPGSGWCKFKENIHTKWLLSNGVCCWHSWNLYFVSFGTCNYIWYSRLIKNVYIFYFANSCKKGLLLIVEKVAGKEWMSLIVRDQDERFRFWGKQTAIPMSISSHVATNERA